MCVGLIIGGVLTESYSWRLGFFSYLPIIGCMIYLAHITLRRKSKSTDCAHHKSIPQVALRWLLQRGIVCIPKSVHRERMGQSRAVFDFVLTPEEVE